MVFKTAVAKSPRRNYMARAAGIGGKLAPVLHGAVGGFASQIGARFLPGYGSALGLGAAGYMFNNPTLLTLAGISLAGMIPIGGFLGGSAASAGGEL